MKSSNAENFALNVQLREAQSALDVARVHASTLENYFQARRIENLGVLVEDLGFKTINESKMQAIALNGPNQTSLTGAGSVTTNTF